MIIRRATENDFTRMMEIYAYARKIMAETGNPNQWGATNWPPEKLIHEDIHHNRSYVCVERDQVVGTFYFDYGKNIEPTYTFIEDGKWTSDDAYGVIHRLAGDGTVRGTGEFCLNWAYDQCGHIRVDTHFDNKVMQKLLLKMGYEQRGIIHVVEDNYPRYAYEKTETSARLETTRLDRFI